ncbi:hypothetical protein [Pseudobdellovibrio sp. HCB154]|uniref:hypothetical protein n=1 Tax=Pseudobdellovibrio sp. HCB154 TaxID=3386277 RepID=UPI0039171003
MKKSIFVKAALVLLTLTATTVVQAQVSPEEYEHAEGQMEAAAYNQAINMKKEFDSIVKKIIDLQEDVGFSTEDSNGLVKALGEKLDMTDELRTEFLGIAAEMQKQEGDELFKSYGKATNLVKEARKNLKEAKALAQQH